MIWASINDKHCDECGKPWSRCRSCGRHFCEPCDMESAGAIKCIDCQGPDLDDYDGNCIDEPEDD